VNVCLMPARAPAAKSTHLAELMGDQGVVLGWMAVDRSAGRLRRVGSMAERFGLARFSSTRPESAELPANCQLRASIGFVDAPLLRLGTLGPPCRMPAGGITPAAIDDLVCAQRRCWRGWFALLKPGGRLVYATCTVPSP